jgi:multimeric flavodoxin WrbA
MSNQMKNVVLISASPKIGEGSVSELLVSMAEGRLSSGVNIYKTDVRRSISRGQTEQDFAAMLNADAIVFAFPLYFFCLSGMLMRFLQDYAAYRAQHEGKASNPKVYATVNCGFPEPDINNEAVRVIKSFCGHTGASFRFGILIGGGGMLAGAKDAPFMKKTVEKLNAALSLINEDISSSEAYQVDNILISVKFPRKLYYLGGNMGWNQMAKKNGLKKKDLYAKPYRQHAIPGSTG